MSSFNNVFVLTHCISLQKLLSRDAHAIKIGSGPAATRPVVLDVAEPRFDDRGLTVLIKLQHVSLLWCDVTSKSGQFLLKVICMLILKDTGKAASEKSAKWSHFASTVYNSIRYSAEPRFDEREITAIIKHWHVSLLTCDVTSKSGQWQLSPLNRNNIVKIGL